MKVIMKTNKREYIAFYDSFCDKYVYAYCISDDFTIKSIIWLDFEAHSRYPIVYPA